MIQICEYLVTQHIYQVHFTNGGVKNTYLSNYCFFIVFASVVGIINTQKNAWKGRRGRNIGGNNDVLIK